MQGFTLQMKYKGVEKMNLFKIADLQLKNKVADLQLWHRHEGLNTYSGAREYAIEVKDIQRVETMLRRKKLEAIYKKGRN